MRFIAERHNRRAIELEESGDISGAIDSYRKAIKSDRSWSVPWFNLGLLHKRVGEWKESLDCNMKAVSINPGDEDAWWNLGIAATAVGDWAEARRAWSECGINIAPGDGPIDEDFGPTPIRLMSNDREEVVWCDRIDPARAIIRSIPLSGRHYGDLILHDGMPRGYKLLNGIEMPVFDELKLIRAGEFETYEIRVAGMDPFEIDEFLDYLERNGFPNEDWSSSLRVICSACSEGQSQSIGHDHSPAPDADRRIGIAARSTQLLRQTLESWIRENPDAGRIETGELIPV